ncbi:competence protein CoiA [Jeotgalibacillus salarius]|uniref:Competence protein CoiA n=1 Tax=Jeotgalibacillus salarius TaxID=546023 RepID=A0A4Y8LCU2_9BACL|nr:competence protein CoiA family protein [Jeotgalibacillus salarius]TFD99292.1 hypothetical protein E2626_15055 [Jeotgalibacillus salarius]
MLIAETLQGDAVSLYLERYNSKRIASLRKHAYRCPLCKSPVILKSGQKVMPHFAHKSIAQCSGFSEGESNAHLNAKTELNKWFQLQSFSTELEKSYEPIHRRTDISVKSGRHEFAVEFQCSVISSELQQKRSSDYREMGLIPFWLLPSELLSKSNLVKLTPFTQQFIKYSTYLDQYFLIMYSASNQSFTVVDHIIPLSKSLFYTSRSVFPQDKVTFPSFPLLLMSATKEMYDVHVKMNEKWILNVFKYRRNIKDPLMIRIYTTGSSVFQTPSWVGLLLRSNIYYYSSPMEWQLYLFLAMKKSQLFSREILLGELKKLIDHRIILKRTFQEPLPINFIDKTVDELLKLLIICDVVIKKGDVYTLKINNESENISAQNRAEKVSGFHKTFINNILQEYNRR